MSLKSFLLLFLSLEQCSKPVIAAINGLCIDSTISLIGAANICFGSAFFQIKENNLAIIQDLGTLQHLPKFGYNKSPIRKMIYAAQ